MTSLPARESLYARLRDVLGEVDAATMMQFLQPDPQEIATRTDIHRLEGRIDQLEERFEEQMDQLERRMDKFDDRLHDFHGALREQTRNFVLASTGSVVTVAALAFAAAALI
jgi:hypothetical protein